MLFKIGVLKKFAMFTRKKPVSEYLFNEVAGQARNFIKKIP